MSQWSPGMSMIGEMFNPSLKSKLDAVCTELAAYVAAEKPSSSLDHPKAGISLAAEHSDWWPAALGPPTAVGGQNSLRYAVFPRRLAICDTGKVEIYDTGNHRISGIAQAQSPGQTMTFTSQDGLIRLSDLVKLAVQRIFRAFKGALIFKIPPN